MFADEQRASRLPDRVSDDARELVEYTLLSNHPVVQSGGNSVEVSLNGLRAQKIWTSRRGFACHHYTLSTKMLELTHDCFECQPSEQKDTIMKAGPRVIAAIDVSKLNA